MAIDDLSKLAFEVGIVLIESLHNKIGVLMAFSEDDGFAQFVAAFDFDTLLHEDLQGLLDGVDIE